MTKQDNEMLARIYNTLLLISTKGEDTVLMADCLRAIRSLLEQSMETSNSVEE